MGMTPPHGAFDHAQKSLEPYVRSRPVASYIRQVLAAHLNTHVNHATAQSQPLALSLAYDSTSVKTSSGTISGLRKEYLKSLRANIKARREYDRVSCTNALGHGVDLTSTRDVTGSNYAAMNVASRNDHLEGYLALIRQRQRHERVRILQDYVNKVEQKSAAAASYLDQKSPQISRLPQVPVDIVAASASGVQESDTNALKALIRSLEQAVLRAKVRLRNEQLLLEQFKSDSSKEHQGDLDSASANVQTLQALGRTRNELISWVEDELGKAGDSTPEDSSGSRLQPSHQTKESVEDQLTLVKAQYGRYVQARKAFIDAVSDAVEPDLVIDPIERKENDLDDPEGESTQSTTWILSPYIGELQLISNEQKASIQQKSHLTVSLAKQHKETMQLFDRLAHESHLLPAYPRAAPKPSRREIGQFDLDEMAGKETPNASHRARAWTYAAESASAATKDTVFGNTEDGQAAIEGARDILSTLEQLLGHKNGRIGTGPDDDDIWTAETKSSKARTSKSTQKTKSIPIHGDIWAVLDGHLGVLQGGDEKNLI
jgi:hypothetical protein